MEGKQVRDNTPWMWYRTFETYYSVPWKLISVGCEQGSNSCFRNVDFCFLSSTVRFTVLGANQGRFTSSRIWKHVVGNFEWLDWKFLKWDPATTYLLDPQHSNQNSETSDFWPFIWEGTGSGMFCFLTNAGSLSAYSSNIRTGKPGTQLEPALDCCRQVKVYGYYTRHMSRET